MHWTWLKRGLVVLVAGLAVPAGSALTAHTVLADDGGDGGGDGGGGGGGGAGGDGGSSWTPEWRQERRRFYRAPRARAPARPARVAPQRPREIVVAGLTDPQISALLDRGFTLRNRAPSPLVGGVVVRLRVPGNVSTRRAIERARAIAPNALVAENTIYQRSRLTSYRPSGGGCGTSCEAFRLTEWQQSSDRCAAGVSIGVVDTAVDVTHPTLRGVPIKLQTVRSADRKASDSDHGTGVVSLIAGQGSADIVGLLPRVRILAADAFHGGSEGSSADTFDLVAALDWLVTEDVRIINMSLTGPDNPILQRAVEQVLARGTTLVVAAGRPDSDNRLGYPARYPGVVAVAAVDNRLRPSRLSARGAHVTFAAPGVGIAVAAGNGQVRRVDGTSFAAPFVTAAFARGLASGRSARDLEVMIASGAKDLGAPGRDPVYGHGLLQFSALPPC